MRMEDQVNIKSNAQPPARFANSGTLLFGTIGPAETPSGWAFTDSMRTLMIIDNYG